MSHYPSYQELAKDFDWAISERELGYNKGDTLNIGYMCSDRICHLGMAQKLALIWEDHQGAEKRFTYNDVRVLSNTRPIYPVDVITGTFEYPDLANLKKIITDHAKEAVFIDATEIALRVKTPILANIIMMGAFAGWGVVPVSVEEFEEAIKENVSPKHVKKNIEAFQEGIRALEAS